MSSELRAETEHRSLGAEMRELARRGFSQPDLVELEQFPALLAATGMSATEAGSRAAVLHAVLSGAIEQLPPRDAEAARLLSGLDPRSKGRSLRERRQRAAEVLDVAADTFRTHRERKLSEQLARALLVQVAAEAPPRRAAIDAARVFVIHDHGDPAHRALVELLRSLGLSPVDVSTLISSGEQWRPIIMDVFRSALENSAAVIALLTPETSPTTETLPARPNQNVLLELGLALGLAPTKTIVVTAGPVDLPSDLAGVAVVQLGNDPAGRDALRRRLRLLGCPIGDDHLDWLDPAIAGDFEHRPDRRRHARTSTQAVGDVLGDRYELLQRFGTGVSSREVWAAQDRSTDERVVLTVWPADPSSSPQDIKQAIQERADLRHPGVVATRDVLAGEDHVVIVSDVIDGMPLASAEQLNPGAAVKLAVGVLDALAALHAHGFVHGDLQPENILIARGGRPVLIDLGLVGRETSAPSDALKAGNQLAEPPIGSSDDVLAAGQLLLSLLSAPGGSRRSAPEETISRMNVSQPLEELLRRAVAADPTTRPSSREMLSRLRSVPEAAGLTSTE